MRGAAIGLIDPAGTCHIVTSAGVGTVPPPRFTAAVSDGGEGADCCTTAGGLVHVDKDRQWLWLPLNRNGHTFGCLCLHSLDVDPLAADERTLLTELADDLAYGMVTLRHRIERESAAERLQRSMEDTVTALAATLEARDPYTAGHQRRVAHLATAIAREMGLDESAIHGIRLASVVHDIGKMEYPVRAPHQARTALCGGAAADADALRSGLTILSAIDFPWPVADIVMQHHERLDGSGYPAGLRGEAILMEARVLAVADHVEAMSADRPYRFGQGAGSGAVRPRGRTRHPV